jgi:hypothetical protein
MTYLTDQTTKEIADKVLDMTKAGVVEVWQKIQQIAPELWKMVVRQVVINGVEYFIGAFFALVLLIFGIWAMKHALSDKVRDGEGYFVTGMFSFLIGIVLFPTFLINGLDLVLNPSYWALKDVLEIVRGRH